jgi:hypothetical protein
VGRFPAHVQVLVTLAARGRQRATFALAVVQGANDQRPVDIVFEKLHQYFLTDARQELAAHAPTGRALRDAYPAGRVGVFLLVKANVHVAQAVAMDFIGAARAGAAPWPDHDRALAAVGGRLRMVTQAVFTDHRAPRGIGRDGIDQVGVAAGAGLGDDGGQFRIGLGQCLLEQLGIGPNNSASPSLAGLGRLFTPTLTTRSATYAGSASAPAPACSGPCVRLKRVPARSVRTVERACHKWRRASLACVCNSA